MITVDISLGRKETKPAEKVVPHNVSSVDRVAPAPLEICDPSSGTQTISNFSHLMSSKQLNPQKPRTRKAAEKYNKDLEFANP